LSWWWWSTGSVSILLSVNNPQVDRLQDRQDGAAAIRIAVDITITAIRAGLQQMVAQPARLEVLQSYTRPTAPDNVPI
jgi:hypothetical protein